CGREDDAHGRPRAGAARARARGIREAAHECSGQPRTSASVSVLAASMTDFACRRPGWRVSRSTGPEIDTAATTRLLGPRTGAETEATPRSRSAIDWAQPRRRTPESMVAEKRAPRRPVCR